MRHEPTLTAFTLGAVGAGVVVFSLLAAAGSGVGDVAGGAIRTAVTAALAAVAVAYGLAHAFDRPIWLPNTYKQVPLVWREIFSPVTANFLYGVGLGAGFMTKVPFATFYVTAAAVFALGEPATGAVAGACFGLGRAVPNWYYRYRGLPLGETESVYAQVDRTHTRMRRANGVALIAMAAALAGCASATEAEEPAPVAPWLATYCEQVARQTPTLACPRDALRGFSPTESTALLRPGREGYVLEARRGRTHWVIAGQLGRGDLLRGYGAMRDAGTQSVAGVRMRWRIASPRGGIFSDHLVLQWSKAEAGYAVSAHVPPNDRAGRRRIVRVARAMVATTAISATGR